MRRLPSDKALTKQMHCRTQKNRSATFHFHQGQKQIKDIKSIKRARGSNTDMVSELTATVQNLVKTIFTLAKQENILLSAV